MVSYLRWLWHEERSVARVLAIAVAILLVCAPGFAVSEIAVLSTVQVVHAQRPAVIHLVAVPSPAIPGCRRSPHEHHPARRRPRNA
jgi:hypothetical protein